MLLKFNCQQMRPRNAKNLNKLNKNTTRAVRKRYKTNWRTKRAREIEMSNIAV